MLHPHSPQRFDGVQFPQPGQAAFGADLLEQPTPIRSNRFGSFCPLLLVGWRKRKSLKRFSYRSPHAGSMCSSSHSGATSESSALRVTHSLSNAFEPTQCANGRQHVGRIGSLLATRFDPAAFPKLLDQTIKQTTFRSLVKQTTAKFGEDREIKA
jgi:hypothetical protein